MRRHLGVKAETRNSIQRWSDVPLAELQIRLRASPSGLGEAEARRRLAQYGHNELAEKKPPLFLKLSSRLGPDPLGVLRPIVRPREDSISTIETYRPGYPRSIPVRGIPAWRDHHRLHPLLARGRWLGRTGHRGGRGPWRGASIFHHGPAVACARYYRDSSRVPGNGDLETGFTLGCRDLRLLISVGERRRWPPPRWAQSEFSPADTGGRTDLVGQE